MLQLLPCPHCGQQSLLPGDTALEATLRCPRCFEQLVLGEALLQQFGSWEVIHDPANIALTELHNSSLNLSQPVVSPVPQSSPAHEELRLAQNQSAIGSVPVSKESVRPYTHFEYERLRRKQKSPFGSILPVVFGGLAAFPIAFLILWHVLGRDVGDVGPTVAEYAPWIVPKQFHGPGKRSSGDQLSQSFRRRVPKSGESGLPLLREPDFQPTPAPRLPEADNVEEARSLPKQEDFVNEQPKNAASNSADRKINETKPEIAEEPAVPAPESSAMPSQSPPVQNLFSTIRETKELLLQLEKSMEVASADRMDLLTSVFDRLAQLAVVFGSIDKDNLVQRTIREQMQPLANIFKRNSELQAVLDKYLEKRIAQTPINAPVGLAMTLEITAVEQLHECWMITGNHRLTASTMIEIPRSLSPLLTTGQRLFVLGVLVPGEAGEVGASAILRVSYLHSL